MERRPRSTGADRGCRGNAAVRRRARRAALDQLRANPRAMPAWVDGPFYADNPRGRHLVPLREARLLNRSRRIHAGKRWIASRSKPNICANTGLSWCVGTAIHSPSVIRWSSRSRRRTPRDLCRRRTQLRSIRFGRILPAPPCCRRDCLERTRATVAGLNLIGLPAAVLAHRGRVLAANDLLIGYAPDIRIAASDRLEFTNPNAHMRCSSRPAKAAPAISARALRCQCRARRRGRRSSRIWCRCVEAAGTSTPAPNSCYT